MTNPLQKNIDAKSFEIHMLYMRQTKYERLKRAKIENDGFGLARTFFHALIIVDDDNVDALIPSHAIIHFPRLPLTVSLSACKWY